MGNQTLRMESPNYQFGEFTLDISRGCVLKAGEEIKLRPKVYETLKYLVENPGRLIGKQELIQAVWPDAFVTDDSVVQCTVELRRALDDRAQQLLKTVPRRGYLFDAQVTKVPLTAERPTLPDSPIAVADRVPSAPKARRKVRDLPVPRTSFVGREQQVVEAGLLLLRDDVRLLTMTGPGGSGKSRLALATTASVANKFSGGAQFVALASVLDPNLVASAIAEALQLQQVANRTIPQLIADRVQAAGPFLLLLDNFEQVLSAAKVVAEILEACPSLKVLATSRACLRIYGEQEFPVTPLPQPSATDLFAERAAAVTPGFRLTSENRHVIEEICSRLDGLPLAIELAAARIKMLPPTAILDRLQSRLQLLTGGALDLPERQHTLRNAIAWSHDLLNEAERKLFRRIAVFVGGCTVESAEAVCNASLDLGMEIFEGLSSLVDQNLIQRIDRAEGEARFAMLETIREYALERLGESNEEPATRRAHAAYCLVLAEEGNPQLLPPDRSNWLAQCDVEIDNLRYALDWLFQTRNFDWAFRLCMALFRFWDMREHFDEGRARLETIFQMAGTEYPKERAKVSLFIGALVTPQGDYATAEYFLNQSLALYEELGDEPAIAAALNALGVSARDRGDYAAAQSHLERSLDCWRNLSDRLAMARCLHNLANVVKVRGDYPRARWALGEATKIFEELGDASGAAWSINQQGDVARAQGDKLGALNLYQQALFSFRETGDPWGAARSLTDIGDIHRELGDHDAAHTAFCDALNKFSELGHQRGIARTIESCACLSLAEGFGARALTLASAAAELRRRIGAPLTHLEQQKLDATLQPARQLMSEAEGNRAWGEGSRMSMESAIRLSMEDCRAVRKN
jgi:predicted ATPase/DNA-binding winged helix-turn-helix (wHTH) protein